jgi:3'-5' exoribonuclease
MKAPCVADFRDKGFKAPPQAYWFFQIRDKEVRKTNAGKPWLLLTLADSSGSIKAKMWDRVEEALPLIGVSDIVKVKATLGEYRGVAELTITLLMPAQSSEYDLADFLPHTKQNIEQMFTRLREISAAMANPWLRQLVLSVLDDPGIAPRLKRAPAAKAFHHAWIGGLLEHVLSLCDLSRMVASHYGDVDLDQLITTAVLHDLGKIEELSYEQGLDYTTPGILVGHLLISLRMARAKMDAISGFPPALATLVEHLLASHHGTLENGSPRLPSTREAVLFNMLDDMDAKLISLRATLDQSAPGEWTERNGPLNRKFLRPEEFLGSAAPATPAGKKS